MPFRRLGDPFDGFYLNRFGHGEVRKGFNWNQFVTFEAGALTPYPTGFDATGGAGAGDLAVNAAAAIRGNFGLEVAIPNTNPRFGDLTGMNNTPSITSQFLLDLSPLTLPGGDVFILSQILSPGAGGVFVQLNLVGTGSLIQIATKNDAGANADLFSTPVSMAHATQIVLEIQAASAPGENDGIMNFYVDGDLRRSLNNVDNDTHNGTTLRIGAVAALDVGTSGSFYLDNIAWANKIR